MPGARPPSSSPSRGCWSRSSSRGESMTTTTEGTLTLAPDETTSPTTTTIPTTPATPTTPAAPTTRTAMRVRKRNGDTEPVDVNKIVRAVDRVSDGLPEVDPLRVATRTISGLYDGATTAELDRLSIQTAAELIGEEPEYSRLAARLLAGYVDKEVRGHGVASFSQSIALGHAEGLIGDATASFVAANAVKLDVAVD